MVTINRTINVTVCGIPAQAEITANIIKGNPNVYACASDSEHYGECDISDIILLDRKGYRAKWLEKKMENTPGEIDKVKEQIEQAL